MNPQERQAFIAQIRHLWRLSENGGIRLTKTFDVV
jgi:hypothetical protein